MKTKINIPIPNDYKLILETGQEYPAYSQIFDHKKYHAPISLDIAHILHIKSSNLTKYILKTPGDYLEKGETIALRKSIFSVIEIKSPIAGYLEDINQKTGLVTINQIKNEKIKYEIPFSFKIIDVHKEMFEIEINALKYGIIKGYGDDIIGKLLFIKEEKLNYFDLSFIEQNSILISNEIDEDQIIKIKVLGGKGLILQEPINQSEITYVTVNKETYLQLIKHKDRIVWLRPMMKEVVVEN